MQLIRFQYPPCKGGVHRPFRALEFRVILTRHFMPGYGYIVPSGLWELLQPMVYELGFLKE